YTQNNFPFEIDSAFFHAEKGAIFGPFAENNTYAVAKLVDIKFVPDSVKARHILINTATPGDSTGYFKLDSLKTLIKKGAKFDQLAKDNSDDVGSAVEGGDLGWFTEGTMVKPFNDACFNGKKGDLVIVESQFGFHLIEIIAQGEQVKKVKLAKLALNVAPSSETYDKIFAEVSKFYAENNNSETFTSTVSKENSNYKKMIADNIKVSDRKINGLGDARELVRWAFNAEKGAISDPLQFDNTYVVAHLAEIKEDGFASLEQIKIEIEMEARKKKKAEQISKEMEGILNIEDLAEKIGVPVSTTSNVNFAAYSIPGLGQEPKVIGVISTIPAGKISSKPIEGNTGVFVVLVENVTPAPETTDYSMTKQELNSQYASISSGILEALKEKFGIVDQRYKFY
ncbi:MAG: peptidylprolyl isomerase, partial [Flavobacteriales bacterium]|nr:peptidylprolyl isomerase [Flavobacteriales bacterium]